MYPDQSLYAYDSVPTMVRRINNTFKRADEIQWGRGIEPGSPEFIDYFLPIVADAEAGFGGVLNAVGLLKNMIAAGSYIKGARVNVLGLTFKENCPDLRNSKVIDVIRELESFGATVHVHDPVAEADEAQHEYGVDLVAWDRLPQANAIVAAVAHKELADKPLDELLTKLAPG
eukprot:gene659-834_t